MARSCCRGFLSLILKFLNFLQTFIGVSIILYSLWMLNHWNHHLPGPPAPSPDAPIPGLSNFETIWASGPLNLAADMVSGTDNGLELHLPAPWFIYLFMGIGVLLCCITCIGHIAAEAINGCCLCFYTLLITIVMLLEAAFVVFVALDHKWEKDLPSDPTGEIENFRIFIKENADICALVGITVIVIQAFSLLFAIVLRAMISTRKDDYDSDDDYAVGRGRTWEPLLNAQTGQTSGSAMGDGKGTHSDIWTSRMRDKYGLNTGDAKYNLLNQKV